MTNEADEERREAAGLVMGNTTALQAMYRDLNPGEARSTLVGRCMRGIERKRWYTCDARLLLALKAVEKPDTKGS